MSKEKKSGVVVDVDNLPHSLGVVLEMAVQVIENGSARDQETLGDILYRAIKGAMARNKYVLKYSEPSDELKEVVERIRKGARDLIPNGERSTLLVALIGAERIKDLEQKNEKLTEMLVKAEEKK